MFNFFFFTRKYFCTIAQTKIKSAGTRRTMGGGGNVRKQITIPNVQRSYRRGLCINIPALTALLHEAAFLPASLAAAVSYHPLSASSKAVKTARQFCLVPEAETCKHAFLQWHLGGRAGRLHTEPAAFIFLRLRQSTVPEPSSLSHRSHHHGPLGTRQPTDSHSGHHIHRHLTFFGFKENGGLPIKLQPLVCILKQPGEGEQREQPDFHNLPGACYQPHPPALSTDGF